MWEAGSSVAERSTDRSEALELNRRVAFFTDSFHEVNGVAHTSRNFRSFAQGRGLPFLNVHAGPNTGLTLDGSVWDFPLKRSSFGIPFSDDMSFDFRLGRHRAELAGALRDFGADLIHITGPSDIGFLGASLARELKIPLAASWHTNVHEFASRRITGSAAPLPRGIKRGMARSAESALLAACLRLYRRAQVLLAPNIELVEMLRRETGRPAYLMERGIDTTFFSPEKRRRHNDVLTIGYVGRLSPEKNVRLLASLETALIASGIGNFKLFIAGEGKERAWLNTHLRYAEFAGVLSGEPLAEAYANMDIFVFPSRTDTYGNVLLEAAASGVPAVVTSSGGPKFLVSHGHTGFVGTSDNDVQEYVLRLARNPAWRREMGANARRHALERDWENVFRSVHRAYQLSLENPRSDGRFRA